MQAAPGETYYYQGGLLMEDFHSNELDRDFDRVLFVDAIYPGTPPDGEVSADQEMNFDQPMPPHGQGDTPGSRTAEEKAGVKVVAAEGAVSIEELYANPSKYEGKQLKVTGQVTKLPS